MQPPKPPLSAAINQLVAVRPEPPGQFTAQVVGLPEAQATAATREEAIEQVRARLGEMLASGQLVSIELPQPNALMQWFGWAKDDPDYQEYLEDIRRYREEVDARARQEMEQQSSCSDSSSTPTT